MAASAESTPISVPVKALASYAFPGGSIVTAARARRLEREGQLAQERAQANRPEDYRKEVALDYLYDAGDVRLRVRGRMDGFVPAPESRDAAPVIEEIKSTRRELAEVTAADVHLAQARIYGAIVCDQMGHTRVRIDLTYVHAATFQERTFDYEYSAEELHAFFHEIVERYAALLRSEAQWRASRNASIDAAPFPYESVRPGQETFMAAVADAIDRRETLFVRAPTGIGKTAAAIVPALRRLASGACGPVFYLSARTTTQAIAEECLDRFRRVGAGVRSVTISARTKVCFLGLPICRPEGCPFAEDYYARLPGALDEIRADPAGGYTRGRIEELARRRTLCPHELSLDAALLADVVICDYNYAFDPMVYLRRFFAEGDPSKLALLVDEAHNLVDRGMEMFTGVVRKKSILAARRAIDARQNPEIVNALRRMNSWLLDLARSMVEEERRFWVADQIDPELEELAADTLEAFPGYFAALQGQDIPDAVTQIYRSLLQFVTVSGIKGEGHRTFAELSGSGSGDLVVKLLCIDPSSLLRERTDRCRSTVFFSATLTPFEYFLPLLYGGEDVVTLSLESPFPPENLRVFIDPQVSTRYRDRERSLDHLVRYARLFSGRGNCIFFFPSYAYLEMTRQALHEQTPHVAVLAQERGMDDLGRGEFLESFVEDHPQGVLAFAVLGGVFGEGIDLVGKRLVAAVIVGVGLPAVSEERNLMQAYYQDRFGHGFSFAYTYPGMNRVLQAAGRVIRSDADTGTVIFFGQRFGHESYRNLLTPEYAHAVKVESVEEVEAGVEAGFSPLHATEHDPSGQSAAEYEPPRLPAADRES